MTTTVTIFKSMFTQRVLCSLISLALIVLAGCSSGTVKLHKIVKSDIDLVSDRHIKENNNLIRELTTKLYRRNPRELAKSPVTGIDSRLKQIFMHPDQLLFKELQYKQSIDAILLGFDDNFEGDRVFALMVGLRGMLYRAYSMHTETYMLDSLDPQKLYNSARNIEILAWRLSHRRDKNGKLFLLTNSTKSVANLSFERLFGKMIALQDMIAEIIADRSQRTINKIVQSIVFLPVG
jgi:hypothetical protein